MLLPALRAYGAERPLTVVLVFAQVQGKSMLCGLFPLERCRKGGIRVLRFWHYLHCYLGVPLVRTGFGKECLQTLFDWLATDSRGAALLECAGLSGEGAFYPVLLDYLQEQQRGGLVTESYARALLRPGGGEKYLETVLSGDKRKKLRRAEQRLGEAGPVRYTALAEDGDVETWLAEFLRLEASGWKGQQGTALVCNAADRDFFLQVMREAFGRRRLMLLALEVAGRPVAHLCNFLAGHGAFAFKVAFDEAHARFSPGVLLELENIRQVQAQSAIRWMDSCTVAGETLARQLWTDRRVIHTLLVETGRAPGPLVLASLPLLRWLRQRLGWFRRRKT